jgi:SpoVK/Ycf46/Vps4 family AAA+-type ATPase
LLGDLLHLSELERMVLLYLVYMGCSRPLQHFFQDIEFVSILKAAETLASIFDCTTGQFMRAIHQKQPLMANGLISKWPSFPDWHSFIELTERVKTALIYPNNDLGELMRHFTNESTPGHLGLDDIPHLQNSMQMLTKVMSNALLNQEYGVNILLYGAPGTGKTEFVKLLAQQVGAILYEVSYKGDEGESASDRERYVSLLMAQKFLSDREDTLLLFDEVEDVLDGSGSHGGFDMLGESQNRSRFSKAWVNQQLEHNPVPVIWICNNHRYIDPAHLRRFLFHLEFRVPPRSVRQRVAERYFTEFNVSEVMIKKLSQNAGLSPAQLESTARLLKLNGCQDQAESEALLETAIRHSMMVMGQSVSQNAAKSITPYRLDYLNVDSQVPMARMLEAMQKCPQASLCFYGPPGTGKTQLAEYLAEQLDQNLIIKRASDLLSKWLGESEQNIAAMFKEARDEQAILFLDEADSFLRDRQGMTKSWEVSQVNELLQQMERFKGIFICATNLFDQLDQAALRRFAFKIRFDYLKPNQRIELFVESLQLATTELNAEQQRRLQKLDQLTPGDFATVLRQAYTLGETPTVNDFLQQLENECTVKNGGRGQRSIGFFSTVALCSATVTQNAGKANIARAECSFNPSIS